MNARILIAAVALVALAYVVAVAADGDAAGPTVTRMDCAAWEAGGLTPAVVANICRRQALMRDY